MATGDPMDWAGIEAARQRKVLYDIADGKAGLPPGTSATQNGEPDLTPAGWATKSGGTAAPEAEATNWLQSNGFNATAPAANTTPTPTPATSTTPAKTFDSTLYQQMGQYLSDYGLSGLFNVNADGSPSGWLFEQMQNGVDTPSEIQLAVEGTQQWQTRFSVIVEQRKLAAQGKPVQVMNPTEVLQYEAEAATTMRNAGLPAWMYDNPQADFHDLMVQGISVPEVQQRLGASFDRVANTPPAVRAKFEEFYGVGNGDGALAAYFLDPTKSLASLDRASREAFTAGTAERYNFHLTRAGASAITDKGLTDAGIEQGFENVNRLSSVFQENAMEAQDLTAEGEGVDSVFGGSGIAQDSIERRIATRKANDSHTTGGALLTQAGAIGAGRIDR